MADAAFKFSPRPNRAREINWRPWSEEAFETARTLDRPILLSISAVWCHWCHVMDETTYSNPKVIELINSQYVPVRVDNDVRPDINQRYNMGGWPTTAFLTPSGDILTGATYLPPEQMAGALGRVASYYRANGPEIAAKALEGRARAGAIASRIAGELSPSLVDSVLEAVRAAYDEEYGGFGPAPKFPQTEALLLLLEQARTRRDDALRRMAVHTFEQMAGGGMYDHVEGGFFRYSTTQDWSVPHFEKMLEDHAGLVAGLAQAGMTEVLDSTTAYLDRTLRDPSTGLYAGSQDADEHYYALDAEGRRGLEAPFVDRRVYSAWNAALAVAYLDAARRCERPVLLEHARAALEALFAAHYRAGEGMAHTEGVGGQLGDQVWGMLAAVRAYSSGLGARWLEVARDLAEHVEDRYADRELGGYFDHAGGEAGSRLGRLEDPIKPLVENSIAAMALVELDTLVGDPAQPHLERARRTLQSVAGLPPQYGLIAAAFARALDRLQRPLKVTTGSPELARAAMIAHPYAVIEPAEDTRAIVCVGTICLAPVSTAGDLMEALQEAASVGG
ncbi:MAG TPA: DUF255 domain-containing protein [Candidatus Dormibacteraeota bacterium]|nr:DUF255 domain-containing protein [Candidatus Dormibacteraeota bacterium]